MFHSQVTVSVTGCWRPNDSNEIRHNIIIVSLNYEPQERVSNHIARLGKNKHNKSIKYV